MIPVQFDPLADDEIDDAVRRSGRRAVVFRQTIDAALALIQTHPQIGAVESRAGERRYILGKRFPYSIIYVELPNMIRVVAFPHHRRRRGYYRSRLRRINPNQP
jgi:plasmid stabilization system protein ParE